MFKKQLPSWVLTSRRLLFFGTFRLAESVYSELCYKGHRESMHPDDVMLKKILRILRAKEKSDTLDCLWNRYNDALDLFFQFKSLEPSDKKLFAILSNKIGELATNSKDKQPSEDKMNRLFFVYHVLHEWHQKESSQSFLNYMNSLLLAIVRYIDNHNNPLDLRPMKVDAYQKLGYLALCDKNPSRANEFFKKAWHDYSSCLQKPSLTTLFSLMNLIWETADVDSNDHPVILLALHLFGGDDYQLHNEVRRISFDLLQNLSTHPTGVDLLKDMSVLIHDLIRVYGELNKVDTPITCLRYADLEALHARCEIVIEKNNRKPGRGM